MKYLLLVLLILVILAFALFATLSLNVSFGEVPTLRAGYCETHGLLSVRVVLPEEAKAIALFADEALESLPVPLSLPARAFVFMGETVLGGIRAAYRSETQGCTAFR